jgi:DsbC/DsbD-like thiol-disulfide interchange protein
VDAARRLRAGEIAWPTPKKLPVGPLMNFGYEGTLLLPVPVAVPADFAATRWTSSCAPSGWCARTCASPRAASSRCELPARPPPAAHGALFAAACAALPQPVPGAKAAAAVQDGALAVRVAGLPAAWQGQGRWPSCPNSPA